MNSPIISIVMPVYNAACYLHESIESVLNQTFTDFEFIIVDDESTDQSIDIITGFKDERIRLILNQHDFIDTLNRGLSESIGKYIARMDADDIMLSHRLQTQYDFMETHPEVDICGSWAERFGHRKGIMSVPTKHLDIMSRLLLGNVMIHPTIMMRKMSLDYNKYSYGYPCAEDYKLWADLVLSGLCFANISDVLLKYRESKGQVTQTHGQEMMYSAYKIQLEYTGQVMERILKENEQFIHIFNSLIEGVNEELIGFKSLNHCVYQIYCDMLKRNETAQLKQLERS